MEESNCEFAKKEDAIKTDPKEIPEACTGKDHHTESCDKSVKDIPIEGLSLGNVKEKSVFVKKITNSVTDFIENENNESPSTNCDIVEAERDRVSAKQRKKEKKKKKREKVENERK